MTSAVRSSRVDASRGSLFYLITAVLLAAGQPLSHPRHRSPIGAWPTARCETTFLDYNRSAQAKRLETTWTEHGLKKKKKKLKWDVKTSENCIVESKWIFVGGQRARRNAGDEGEGGLLCGGRGWRRRRFKQPNQEDETWLLMFSAWLMLQRDCGWVRKKTNSSYVFFCLIKSLLVHNSKQ